MANDVEVQRFRENIMGVQNALDKKIADGEIESVLDQCVLRHFFTPIDKKYGCSVYARQIFLPKGSLVIGKIHKHAHLNFILSGKVSVSTEFGPKHYEAPCTFVSEPGLKRAVVVHEDTIWTTIHLTGNPGEDNLDKIEDEVIAKTYEELGLIDRLELEAK